MRRFFTWLCLFSLFVQTVSFSLTEPALADGRTITLVGNLQDELGGEEEWNPADPATVMTPKGDGKYELRASLPAGTYEYKIAVNGSWDENYGIGGEAGGANYKLILEWPSEVTFAYNDNTRIVTVHVPLPDERKPRIVGDLQPDIGAGRDWSPEESTALMEDPDRDGIYTLTADVPKGTHQFKVVLGNNWSAPSYPAENFVLNVLSESRITFFFHYATKAVYTDYDPGVPDGSVTASALYHDTWDPLYRSPFGAVEAGKSVRIRLRAKKGDLTHARLLLRNQTTGNSKLVDMTKAGWAEVDGMPVDFWEAVVKPEEKGVWGYKFIVRDGDAVKEYGEDADQGRTGQPADSHAALFQLTVFDPSYRTPDWMKNAVIYQIFPDRFFNGNPSNDRAKNNARGSEPIELRSWDSLPDNPRLADREGYDGDGIWSNDFFGGDIEGIRKKLDYLQSLGVNVLYLNPIAHAASNHKYDATDYTQIDPMFGTPEEFNAFVKELKKRGMRLILDGVFNHVGDDSIYFDRYGKYKTVGAYEYWSRVYDLVNTGMPEEEAKKRVEQQLRAEGQEFSPYGFHNWFRIENRKENGVYKYQAWWGFDSLPEIASVPGDATDHPSELNNRSFANYIMYAKDSVAKTWLKRGASGWRLDVANEVDPEFWREFRKELKKEKKTDPIILGEIWDDASKYLLGDLFDSVMNYRFRDAVLDLLRNGHAEKVAEQLEAIREDYPSESWHAMMNLIGSHDTARAVFLLGGGTDSHERAEDDPKYNHELGIRRMKLASLLQMGFAGAPTIYYGDEAGLTGSKDPDDRRPYPWGNEHRDLLAHYRQLGQIRKQFQSLLALGDTRILHASGDILVIGRKRDGQAAIVAVNRGSTTQTIMIDMQKFAGNGTRFKDRLSTGSHTTVNNGEIRLTLPPLAGQLWIADHVTQPPRPVKDLNVREGNGEVTLSWKGSAPKYKVYVTTVSGGLYQEVAVTKNRSITLKQLDNGRKYEFAVTAVDARGNESDKTTISAVPHIPLTSGNHTIRLTGDLAGGVLDLSKPQTVTAELVVDNATPRDLEEGITARLEIQVPGSSEWTQAEAAYAGQSGNAGFFSASFVPLEPGEYTLRFAFSSDSGRTWKTGETRTVTYHKGDDSDPPADGVNLRQPQQESGQVSLAWTLIHPRDPFLTVILRNGKEIARLWDPQQTTFRDLDVSNGTAYRYRVKVYDRWGNAIVSDEVSVTPDLVMVQVTFKVRVPDYTPQNVKLTIPNSRNGWNTGAWEMTRAGAVSPDYTFTTEIPEGETITYKYVKNGTWDQEGLADHTPHIPDDDDVSLYGYGAIGTDLNITVTNQGGNRMVVEDRILRWIDMPVVITSHTDGQTVSQETVTLSGNAIKEGVLTINGQRVSIQDDMSFSHPVSLNPGSNTIRIRVEPSEENKSAIFKNDGEAIAKATREITLTLIRE
ncbi:alpha amylase N-terminal ig-like domain-containing protein [Staphylospora marina]|uniref:alpha amylase N-terminal ig-like domain-containing protein n=1 Tax=Staphylospora marina TaxID=2490858 RepID=UPI000F5B8C9E|nr:alpha amylase N-terminal ig-like domain-containing protein [Staphylospora marina]